MSGLLRGAVYQKFWKVIGITKAFTKKWNTGIVHEKLKEPYSLDIQMNNGTIYRRNRNTDKFLLPVNRMTFLLQTLDSCPYSWEAGASGSATTYMHSDVIPAIHPAIT